MKNKGECPIPGEDALAILSKVYEDALRSRCTYFTDSPTVREQLLDSFCRSDGQTSGVFSLSNYPWITATPDVPPIMVQGKSILIHCEILDGPKWINSKIVAPGLPAKTPESKALAAVKRKMQCLMHVMKECLADLFPHPVALLYLADSSGAIHYEEEFAYDPAIKRGIHLAACTYTDEVYNCLRRSSTLRGFGELKTWQQPKKKFKIGSVVFDVKGHRPFPGCFGKVIKMDNDNIYVDWNGTDGNGRNYPCKKANLLLVPIVKIVPPTQDGDLVDPRKTVSFSLYSGYSSVYITASSDSSRESEEEEGIEIGDSHGRMCNFVHDKRLQMEFMSSDKAFKFTGKDVRDTFIINYQDAHRWFGNDAVDIFVSYLNFRYPERTSGIHAVPSFSTAAMLGKSAEQQMKLWSFYARREGLYESKPRMLLVPLNTSNIHWSLAVVGNPFAPADLFVLHVDSQGMGKDTLTSDTEGFIKSLVQTLSEHDERIKIHQSEKAHLLH
ncbi:hypothetical protein M9434_007202 [Picochlorum sp. BPE23]|nr:hypothetical protein M9434_007202 [Picochlorum sp. BPE23]